MGGKGTGGDGPEWLFFGLLEMKCGGRREMFVLEHKHTDFIMSKHHTLPCYTAGLLLSMNSYHTHIHSSFLSLSLSLRFLQTTSTYSTVTSGNSFPGPQHHCPGLHRRSDRYVLRFKPLLKTPAHRVHVSSRPPSKKSSVVMETSPLLRPIVNQNA